MPSAGRRSIAFLALLLLPVWAALDATHRTALLPSLEDAAAHELIDAPFGALLALAPDAAWHPQLESAPPAVPPPAATPFAPGVARWRSLVEAELQTIRATRSLSEVITPDLVLAVIAAESGGDPDARSHAHAAGLMQVLPTTLASLLTDTPTPSPFDPVANVRAGILYLDEAMRSHRGDLEWALAAYNAGIPATLRARSNGGAPYSESSAFATRVLAAVASAG